MLGMMARWAYKQLGQNRIYAIDGSSFFSPDSPTPY